MPRAGAAMLSDYPSRSELEFACDKCGRNGRYLVENLTRCFGDMGLPELLCRISGDCQRRIENRFHDQCGAYYPQRDKTKR
jgi:hypothetical protein